jgi:hypothetical protein
VGGGVRGIGEGQMGEDGGREGEKSGGRKVWTEITVQEVPEDDNFEGRPPT